jgi:hypothetical protein
LPPDPVVLHYSILVAADQPPRIQAFDIELDRDDWAIKSKMNSVLVGTAGETSKAIATLDEEVRHPFSLLLWSK